MRRAKCTLGILTAGLAIAFCTSCLGMRAYLDDQLGSPSLSELRKPLEPKPVEAVVEFTRNGTRIGDATQEAMHQVERILTDSDLFSMVTVTDVLTSELHSEPSEARLVLRYNNVADLQQARLKGRLAGASYGLSGQTVEDEYVLLACLEQPGREAENLELKQRVYYTIGLEGEPKGAHPVPKDAAVDQALERLLVALLVKLQTSGAFK